ncbi:carboxypeptidase A5 [Plectosphaerella cucumerina]|uniref:Carboxypeptidase A5 n=1 Tax=Plectosphaerella cucumerina TaxID=40658 RepID=A0A8K0X671_9PEZI|nr:carboxypeptidase A5 [Plectosphaerella cucumerina]
MKFISAFSAAAIGLLASTASARSYDGWKVLRIDTSSGEEAALKQLSSVSYDVWESGPEKDIDIAVSPSQLALLEGLGLSFQVLHEDLGASIAAESSSDVSRTWKRQADDLSWFDAYHSYDEHIAYFEALHAAFPNNSEIVSTGTSYEGRNIWGLHFWGANGPGQPAVLWHGTVHAREWIASKVIEYLTSQLILNYGKDDQVTGFVDDFDFWIFPFVNPDGFVYTQTTDRLWRKNRQPGPSNATCAGRDINRNWPHQWDSNPLGASTDPCHYAYKGEAPGDAPEMAGLHAFVDNLRDTSGIKLFIDWHSYSQYLLAPLGYNCTSYVPNLGQHLQIAHRAARAIRGVNGVQFTYGPSCPLLYASTGYSVDYAYEVGKADYAYLIELRDTGNYGFVLPPDQILPSVLEQWEGIKVILGFLNEVIF